MAHITIVGLGPGSPDDLTREAWRVIAGAEEVWLRTMHHPVVPYLPSGPDLHTFDPVYERAETFADVYHEIVTQVLALGRRDGGVIYAVPGHPMVGEATVARILQDARDEGVPLRVVAGLSFIEPALSALGLDALDGLQIVDALDLVGLHHPPLNPDVPALIGQVYSRAVASELKLVLMNQYDDGHPTVLLDGAGTDQARVRSVPLYEIDRYEATPLTTLYVSPVPAVTSFEGFEETIAHLRAPDGCPWDREQTHQSLRTNLLEECYEVLEAIDDDDAGALQEELGDLLLQIVLHAQIAVEEGAFRMTDVIAQIDAKLKRRHPHVWGGVDVDDVGEVITNWEAIKRRERADKGTPERSLLDGIPGALPALAQATAYADRAGRIGFNRIRPHGEWVDLPGEAARQLSALLTALDTSLEGVSKAANGSRLLGDLMLAIADWARCQDIDPEGALREANRRFAERLRTLESAVLQKGTTLSALSSAEIRRIWDDHGVA
ncbi:MAG: nucleoside triphosphate pyrophosphohydrolase [Anaerolineae bacterium]